MALKGGNLFVDGVSAIPSEVQSGAEIDVAVTVANGALHITAGDPDNCSNDNPCAPTGGLETEGYCAAIRLEPSWRFSTTKHQCIQQSFAGVNRHTFEFAVPAPADPGDYEIDVVLVATGSEQEEQADTLSFAVPGQDGGGGNGGGGNGGGNGGDGGSGDGGCPEGHVDVLGRCVPRERIAIGAGVGVLAGLGLAALSDR